MVVLIVIGKLRFILKHLKDGFVLVVLDRLKKNSRSAHNYDDEKTSRK